MREESSEQSGENIPLLSLLYFVFLGQRMQTRLPISVSFIGSAARAVRLPLSQMAPLAAI